MNPILVPTLAELGIEFDRAYAAERVALTAAADSDASRGDPLEIAYEQAVGLTSSIIDQIAAIPAASIADLRVKAKALDWYHQTVEGPNFGKGPCPGELLAQQLVAGLSSDEVNACVIHWLSELDPQQLEMAEAKMRQIVASRGDGGKAGA